MVCEMQSHPAGVGLSLQVFIKWFHTTHLPSGARDSSSMAEPTSLVGIWAGSYIMAKYLANQQKVN